MRDKERARELRRLRRKNAPHRGMLSEDLRNFRNQLRDFLGLDPIPGDDYGRPRKRRVAGSVTEVDDDWRVYSETRNVIHWRGSY